MKHPQSQSRQFVVRLAAALVTITLLSTLVISGCSVGSSAPPMGGTSTQTAKTTVQVNMGDSPADWMLAFSMNISSMTLNGNNGSVTVVSTSVPMEMMHLMGTMQPMTMVSVPQGTYTGASITMSSATVGYMDPTTKTFMQKTISGPITKTVTFSSAITVGSTPMALGFDLDLANSVTADSSGNFTMNPVYKVTSGMQGSGNPMDWTSGGIQRMMGVISGVSGSSFTMTSMQAAQSFTFMTNSSTSFANGSMGTMTGGMTVLVDATLQADGSLMATRVDSMMNSSGMMGGGIVTAITGQPATSLAMVMQNGAGSGMMSSYFAQGATVNLSSSATFIVDHDNIDISGLPFTPTFDASHLYVGQNVMPVSSSGMMSGGTGGGMMGGGMMSGTISASSVYLEPQGLSGAVSAAVTSGSTTSFSLTLPTDCAFTSLTGVKAVTVYQQTGTLVGGSPIQSGASAHIFGLLFYDGGQWKMVAARIAAY